MSVLCVVSGGSRGGARGWGALIFRQTEVRGAEKIFWETAPPYVRIWMTAPLLSQGLHPALVVGGMLFLPPWFFRYKGVGYTRAESHCTLFLTLCSFLREAVARNGIWYIDCEQSLLSFRFGKGSARARERWAAKLRDARRETRDARNEGGSLSRLAPSVTRVVICVSQAFCLTDQEKRETARSLYDTSILTLTKTNREYYMGAQRYGIYLRLSNRYLKSSLSSVDLNTRR